MEMKMGEQSADSYVYLRGFNSLSLSFVSENHRSSVCAHRRHKANFPEYSLDTRTTYCNTYRSLSLQKRVKREQLVAKEILAAFIIDAKQWKQDQYGYLCGNKVLASDCLKIIDRVKKRIEKNLRIELDDLSGKTTPLIDYEEQQADDIAAITLLGKASKCG